MNNNHEEIIARLREPFNSKEIEWKVRATRSDVRYPNKASA